MGTKSAFWKPHLDGWRDSGLSQAAYCRQHALSVKCFAYWRRTLGSTLGVASLHAGRRVASHARCDARGSHTTVAEHMPAAHRAHLEWSPGRFLHWATDIGPATHQLVEHLLTDRPHPEMGYRSCLGLLSQAKHYGPARLEAACTLALELRAGHYRHVRDILANGGDLVPRSEPAPEWVAPAHDNVRGAANYH